MKTTFAKSSHRSLSYTKFATPLVLDPPRHSDLPTIQLGLGKHLIGTSPDCSVRVRVDDVAPRHALIVVSEHRTVVKALDPRTWVNEGPVSEMALRPGDRLSIGPLTLRVRAASPDELADFVTVYENTFDDDGSHAAEVVGESPVKSTFLAKLVDETRPTVAATPVTAAVLPAVFPVVGSISTEVRAAVVPTPLELPKVAAAVVAVTAMEPSPIASSAAAVKQPAPAAVVTTTVPAHNADVPAARSTSTETLGSRLDEIEQILADLQQPIGVQSAPAGDAVLRIDALAAERRQLIVRQDELQRRADELAHQSQQLHERVARVAERETDVERSQTRLALEHEQLSATAEITRKELDEEYARHMTLWQEWDAAYRRTSGELNGQLQSMEQRRTALLAEADRLAGERSELQRLQAEHERDRRVHAAERVQLTTDRAALQTRRAEFDTERQQHLVAVQEREARVAAERRAMSVTQEELLGTRQQLERDRTEFLAERATEALRREQELREHVELRERLDRDHTRLQAERLEGHELCRVVERQRAAFDGERGVFNSQQAAIAADRIELSQVREQLQQVESDLARLQQTHETTRSALTLAESSASVSEPPSLDWFVEPYKSLDMPPPIPADRSDQEPLDHSLHAVTSVASSLADILPFSAAFPTMFDEPKPSVVETACSFADAVCDDEDVPQTVPTPQVTAPAAASHRFWEDNTLYDTSVLSHSPHPAPTTFVASSNLMMRASAVTPTVATPLEAVASGDVGTRSASSATFNESPVPDSVAMWSRSLNTAAPDVDAELESSRSTATATADDLPTVDETLAEINRQFGTPLPTHETAPTENVAALPNWWSANESTTVTTVEDDRSPGDSSSEIAASRTADTADRDDAQFVTGVGEPSATSTASADPLASLRAQLAMMFDLPAQGSSETQLDEPAVSADVSATDEPSHDDHDGMELTLAPTADDVSMELPPETPSRIESESNSILPSVEETATNDDSSSSVQAADTDSPPEAANDGEADDSVETYMARLLSRTRGGVEVSASEVMSFTAAAAAASETSRQRDASHDESPVRETTFDPADRSHLTAEPKHKQDRQAARDDLQSFRQVAHQSARSALARHTTKNLLSAVVAKSLLLGVSTLATVAFLGAPLVGMPTQLWKGVGCSLASLLSAIEVYRSWRLLRGWKAMGDPSKRNTQKTVASSTNASAGASSDETTSVTSATVVAE